MIFGSWSLQAGLHQSYYCHVHNLITISGVYIIMFKGTTQRRIHYYIQGNKSV